MIPNTATAMSASRTMDDIPPSKPFFGAIVHEEEEDVIVSVTGADLLHILAYMFPLRVDAAHAV